MPNDYEEKQTAKDIQAKIDYDNCNLTAEQRRILAGGKDLTYHSGGGPKSLTNCGLTIVKSSSKDEPGARKLRFNSSGNPDIAEEFRYDDLDSREDIVRECIRVGGNLNAIISEFVLHDSAAYQSGLIRRFANLIIDSPNPKLELQTILKSGGMLLNEGYESGETIGTEFGISRQAISKKMQSKKKKLGLPQQTRDSKSASSKETYRKNNQRNHKI